METTNIKPILDKFKELREKEVEVFDFSKLVDKGFRRKEDIIFDDYHSFSESLGKEINSLPLSETTIDQLLRWIDNLDYWIKSKNGANLSDTSKLLLKYRKELKRKLIDICTPMQVKATVAKETKEEITKSETKENLTLKQQVLLLVAMGIMNKEEIKDLPDTRQAKLFSHLLNRSEKKVKDLLTYIDKKDPNPDFFIFKDDNIKKINNLLESVDLQEYCIKL
jgi:hypothetical protein